MTRRSCLRMMHAIVCAVIGLSSVAQARGEETENPYITEEKATAPELAKKVATKSLRTKHEAYSEVELQQYIPGQVEGEVLKDETVQTIIKELRQQHLDFYRLRESTVFGTLPDAAARAATQQNLRKIYMNKESRKLTAQEKTQALNKYAYVQILCTPRSGIRAFDYGVTGAKLQEYHQQSFFNVYSVEKDSPADGKLLPGDRIIGAFGYLFPANEDPRIPAGYAIAEAQTERKGGTLLLNVIRGHGDPAFYDPEVFKAASKAGTSSQAKGPTQSAGQTPGGFWESAPKPKVIEVELDLGVEGDYAQSWPFNCEKSQNIFNKTVQYYLDNYTEETVNTLFDPFFLLSADSHAALDLARRRLYKLDATYSDYNGSSWALGYGLTSLGEYYLMTGDPHMLDKMLKGFVATLEDGQSKSSGSWGHGNPCGGYGEVNQVGLNCFMGLILSRECGLPLDSAAFERSARFFGKGLGCGLHYGNHTFSGVLTNPGTVSDNGHNSSCAINYALLNAPDLAARSSELSAYAYRNRIYGHAGRAFPVGWGPAGLNYVAKELREMSLNNQIWLYEIMRQRNGSFSFPVGAYKVGMGAMASMFAVPQKKLRIYGAPKSIFSQTPPTELKKAMELYALRDWDSFEIELKRHEGSSSRNVAGFAQALRAKYEYYVKEHVTEVIKLARKNLEKDPHTARNQILALEVYYGQTTPEMVDILEQTKEAQPLPRPPGKGWVRPESPLTCVAAETEWTTLLPYETGPADTFYTGNQEEYFAFGDTWHQPDFSSPKMQALEGDLSIDRSDRKKNWTVLRRVFKVAQATLDKGITSLRFDIPRDAVGEVYINGIRLAAFEGAGRGQVTRTIDIPARGVAALRGGENVASFVLNTSGDKDGTVKVAMFGAVKGGTETVEPSLPSHSSIYFRNGWHPGLLEELNPAEFVAGKTPEALAPYFCVPDGAVATRIAASIAGHGKETIPLMKRMLKDKSPWMRIGAWKVLRALDTNKMLTEEDKLEILGIAADMIDDEDSWVMQHMADLVIAFGIENASSRKIMLAMASCPTDAGTRAKALKAFDAYRGRGPLFKTWSKEIALQVAIAGGQYPFMNDAGLQGTAIVSVQSMAEGGGVEQIRDAAPMVATMLDEVSHNMRGMFSNGTIDRAGGYFSKVLDAELEQRIPQLVPGMIKSWAKIPYTDWTGWPVARHKMRQAVYMISPSSAATVAETAEWLENWLRTVSASDFKVMVGGNRDEGKARDYVLGSIAEMRAWSECLGQLKGKDFDDDLFVKYSTSDNPHTRRMAVSAVLSDRVKDAAKAIEIAINVASRQEGSLPENYRFSWQVLTKFKEKPEVAAAFPALGKVLTEVATTNRDMQSLFIIVDALPVMKHWVKKDKSALIESGAIEGMALAYLRSAYNGYWSGADKQAAVFFKTEGLVDAEVGAVMLSAVKKTEEWLSSVSNSELTRLGYFRTNHDAMKKKIESRMQEFKDMANKVK